MLLPCLKGVPSGNSFEIGGVSASTFGSSDLNPRLFINVSTGNVGIGTVTPTVKTHIYNVVDGIFTGLAIDNRKTYGVGTGTNETSRLILSLSETATPDPLNTVMGYISAGTESETTSAGGFMALGTRIAGSETEKVRITSNGNVGIGTTSPEYKLDVQDSNNLIAKIYGTNTQGTFIHLRNSNSNNAWNIAAGGNNGWSDNSFVIDEHGVAPRLTINPGGNVGIGTTSPVNPFQTTLASGAGFPYICINQTGDNPYLELQRWTGSGSNYEGVRIKNIVGSGGQLAFETTQGGGAAIGSQTFTERMRIVGDNVGIGTVTPPTLLALVGNDKSVSVSQTAYDYSSGVPIGAQLGSWSSTACAGIKFHRWTGTGTIFGVAYVGQNTYGGGSYGIDFQANTVGSYGDATTSRMFITPGGNVGIGTTSPSGILEVEGGTSTSGIGRSIYLQSEKGAASNNGGDVIIGVGQNGVGANNGSILFGIANAGSPGLQTEFVRIASDGNIGIGTNNPLAQLHTTGTVRFAAFGAGTMQTDASGNVSVSSDARLKHITGDFTTGLDAIMGLTPKTYKWNKLSGLDEKEEYSGFIAQNVQQFIPEAVNIDNRGFLTLSDRPIIAVLVNAIKEQQKTIDDLNAKNIIQEEKIKKMDKLIIQNEVLNSEIKTIKQFLGIENSSLILDAHNNLEK